MPVRAQKDTAMNLAAILALLALDAGATENEAVSAIQKLKSIEASTGKLGDEALGVVKAWSVSHGQLVEANAKIANLEKERDDKERAELISNGEREGKIADYALTYAGLPWTRSAALRESTRRASPVRRPPTRPTTAC